MGKGAGESGKFFECCNIFELYPLNFLSENLNREFRISKIVIQDGDEHEIDSLASFLFRGRLRPSEKKITKEASPLKAVLNSAGEELCLLYVKTNKSESKNFTRQLTCTATYVATESPGEQTLDLQEELEKLADFASLKQTCTVTARIKLLFTDAYKFYRKHMIYSMEPSLFEEVEERGCLGCGFVPRHIINYLFGNRKRADGVVALQVRILCPRLGLFKGMLIEKPGIDKIQLPPSMKKVGPAKVKDYWGQSVLLVKAIFPSRNNNDLSACWTSWFTRRHRE